MLVLVRHLLLNPICIISCPTTPEEFHGGRRKENEVGQGGVLDFGRNCYSSTPELARLFRIEVQRKIDMGLIPTTKKHVLTLVSELLRQGEFTVHELFDKLYSRGQQIGLADLQELLDEKVKDETFTVSDGPIKRYSLKATLNGRVG